MKKLLKRSFRLFDLDLHKSAIGYSLSYLNAPGWRPEFLRQLGRPKTVIDVGVGFGTPELYSAFPDSFFALCEPLQEYDSFIAGHLQNIAGKHFRCAIGAEDGQTSIQVEKDVLQRSSLNKRSALTATEGAVEERKIPISRLDTIARNEDFPKPYALKIDTEGFELEVIRGATHVLRDTLFVISEVSVAKRFEGGYSFYEFVSAMHERGFELLNVLHIGQQRGRMQAGYMDIVFARLNETNQLQEQ